MRNTIREIKTLVANIKTIAMEEGKTFNEVASLLQTGAAVAGDDRLINLIAIAKRRV